MTAYLQKLRRLSRDVRAYLLFKTLESLAVWGIRAMLLNLYLLRLGYGPEFIGIFHATGLLLFALCSLPASALGARWGMRRTLIAGTGVLLVSFWLLPLADLVPDAWQTGWLFATNVSFCLGAVLYYVNATPYLMGVTRGEERDRAFSVEAALIPLATFTGNLVGGLLPRFVASTLDVPLDGPAAYRYPLWAAAALMVPALLALLHTREVHTEQAHARNEAKGRPSYGLIAFLATFVLLRAVGGEMGKAFLNVYLDDRLHLPTAQIGLLMALGQLVSVPAALLMPLLVARWGRLRTVVWCALGSALFILLQALVPHWSGVGVGSTGASALVSIALPAYIVFCQESVPARWRSTMSGAILMATTVGMAGASLGGGYAISAWGYAGLFAAGAALVALGALILWGRFCAQGKQVHGPVLNPAEQV
jgi:MFS family permease